MSTDPDKIKSIVQWPIPKTLKQLRGILGLTGYYRRFIRDYGKICRPLTQLLKKDSFTWNTQPTAAFEELKVMTTPPVLALPDFSQTFVIKVDASGVGIGAVLMQNGNLIVFLSKALSPRNLLLSTYERELLALILAVTKWQQYLTTKQFTVKTDQQSLKHLLENKITTTLQQRWLSKLMGYSFDIQYKQGHQNKVADALSRVDSSELCALVFSSLHSTLMDRLSLTWASDPTLLDIVRKLEQNS